MKKYCALAFSLIAVSLFADNGSYDDSSRSSLFGDKDNADSSQSSRSGSSSSTRTSLFGGSEDTNVSLLGEKPPKTSRPMHPPFSVFLDSPPTTVELSFTSLILQPTGSNLHYAAQANPLPVPTPNWKIHDIETDYTYGFDLGLSGNFPNSYTNLSLDWEHFNSHDSASKKLSSSDMIGPFFEIGPDATPYTKAHGRVKFIFDQVNLDYGIFVHLGSRLRTNLFAGLGFAQIKQHLESKFSDPTGTIHRTIETPSKFIGAGPRFGVNFCYKISHGFKLREDSRRDFFMRKS